MHDAAYAPLQALRHRYHQSAVAYGRCHVLVYKSLALCIPQYAVQRARDASLGARQFTADVGQFGRRAVLDFPELVEYAVYGLHELRKRLYALGQSVQGGVGMFVPVAVGAVQVVHDAADCVQRAAQVEQLAFVHVGALKAKAAHRLPYVEEILHGEVVGFFLQSAELPHLCQPFVDDSGICRRLHDVNQFLAQRTKASLAQQRPYFVEADFAFKCFRVNHAAKLLILRVIAKHIGIQMHHVPQAYGCRHDVVCGKRRCKMPRFTA